MAAKTLDSIRNDDSFRLFWKIAVAESEQATNEGVSKPNYHRKELDPR